MTVRVACILSIAEVAIGSLSSIDMRKAAQRAKEENLQQEQYSTLYHKHN